MDGVPGLTFDGIQPGETFTYRFDVSQSGTYWYHSHSGFQEQTGLYGPLVIEPRGGERFKTDRDYVLMLSDWSDDSPELVMANLKKMSDFYNFNRPTAVDFAKDASRLGLQQALAKRKMWNLMRMSPADLSDVTGHHYTYLINGASPAANWTGLFKRGEKVRLRVINGSAQSIFDLRIPGLRMTVVAADGQDVEPVTVDEFRIAVAETYDVIVEPADDRAYTIFAQSIDREGYARATLAPRPGMQAEVPPADKPQWLTMVDMMGSMAMGGDMAGMDHGGAVDHAAMGHGAMQGMDSDTKKVTPPKASHARTEYGPGVDMRVDMPRTNIDDPGIGLRDNGRKVLTYADLHTIGGPLDKREPGARDRAAPHGPHGALHVVVRRPEVQRRQAAALPARRAAAHRARQRHHDAAPDPPARHVERDGEPERRVPGQEAHDHGAAGAAHHLPGQRRRARQLGLPLPSALSHGSGHVQKGGGVVSAGRFKRLLLVAVLAAAPTARAQSELPHDMDAAPGSMQGGEAPPGARDPDAYAEGLENGHMPGMDMADNATHAQVLLDRVEQFHSSRGNGQAIAAQAWAGGDIDKLWLMVEGERENGRLGATRAEALWNHAIAPYWGLQAGARHDFGGGPGRTWASFGVQGLSPYWFDVRATAYVGQGGRTALRLEAEYDLLLTQRLVLQPAVQLSLHGRNDPDRRIGAGLSGIEAGLRLRYEISRKFAPYIGVVWSGKFGDTARYARDAGDAFRELRFVAGLRLWF